MMNKCRSSEQATIFSVDSLPRTSDWGAWGRSGNEVKNCYRLESTSQKMRRTLTYWIACRRLGLPCLKLNNERMFWGRSYSFKVNDFGITRKEGEVVRSIQLFRRITSNRNSKTSLVFRTKCIDSSKICTYTNHRLARKWAADNWCRFWKPLATTRRTVSPSCTWCREWQSWSRSAQQLRGTACNSRCICPSSGRTWRAVCADESTIV